jgi:hypothetical protein
VQNKNHNILCVWILWPFTLYCMQLAPHMELMWLSSHTKYRQCLPRDILGVCISIVDLSITDDFMYITIGVSGSIIKKAKCDH